MDFTVRVNANVCKEDKDSAMSTSQIAALDCQVEAGGSVKVVFPRKAWVAVKFQDPNADAGPGK